VSETKTAELFTLQWTKPIMYSGILFVNIPGQHHPIMYCFLGRECKIIGAVESPQDGRCVTRVAVGNIKLLFAQTSTLYLLAALNVYTALDCSCGVDIYDNEGHVINNTGTGNNSLAYCIVWAAECRLHTADWSGGMSAICTARVVKR